MHQPRSNIYHAFHRLLLLSRGTAVYSGALSDSYTYCISFAYCIYYDWYTFYSKYAFECLLLPGALSDAVPYFEAAAGVP